MSTPEPFMLMILDGWGINKSREGNAVAQSDTLFLDEITEKYPDTQLTCSGEAVGLPAGVMGNSEVGHLNIGAGRVVYQDLLRIDMAIRDDSFFKNQALNTAIDKVLANNSTLHLMGLLSDGGVHSQLKHLFALIDLAEKKQVPHVAIHVILDGRDTAPNGGMGYVKTLESFISGKDFVNIATVCGRFYAMDRDTRWERTKEAFRLYVSGEGLTEDNPADAVQNAYERGETDEFVKPVIIKNPPAPKTIGDGDAVIFFNFRADRARQITRAFNEKDFKFFDVSARPDLSSFVCMTKYDENFDLPVAFAPVHMQGILGEVISKKGLKQLRIAETEKYAHVTYFFNGGEETPFTGEERCLIPSPRDVETYDQKPEMSAEAVRDEVVSRMKQSHYDLIVLNFANMDMVGHTGDMAAAVKACETVDACAKDVVAEVMKQGGTVFITADHGNAELMRNENGETHTAHTMNPVPFIVVSSKNIKLRQGSLGDIAPTILDLMQIEKPEQMTGESLIVKTTCN